MKKNNYRIGIVGGMGPMAGVMLQQLIIEATPAAKDQDHLEVVCFTNPHIPDRTRSLQENDGKEYANAIIDSIKILEKTAVDCVAIPCNTSHARFDMIQNAVDIPVLNMVGMVVDALKRDGVKLAGLLATDGTVASGVFSSDPAVKIVAPDPREQKEIMDVIYGIKAGKNRDPEIASRLRKAVENLRSKGAEKVILGCTELSLYLSYLKNENVVDPLSELARGIVDLALGN